VTTQSVSQAQWKRYDPTIKYTERFHPDEWNHP